MSAAAGGTSTGDSPATGVSLVSVACVLFAYVAWRASRLAITWDEAANYLEYTRLGLLSPFRFRFPHFGSNNHFLNSWLTFLTTWVAGPGEVSLRAPVLAAHLLYLYYTARFARAFDSSLDRVCAFGVLNLNPYLLDFFSLSRGYGLSYGLLAGSLWHLHEYLRTDFKPRHGLFTLGFALLAVSAHLTLVHFLVALGGVVVLAPVAAGDPKRALLRRMGDAVRANAVALASVVLFLLPTMLVIRRLARAGAFFYGGRIGFWEDTVLSLMGRSLYEQRHAMPRVLGVVSLMVVGCAALVVTRRWRTRSPAALYLPALLALLVTCALASIVQHHLLGVLYLTGRTALYLLVLWTFVLVALLRELAPLHPTWRHLLHGVALLLALHAARSANGRYVLEWKSGAEVREVLGDLGRHRLSLPPGKPSVDLGASLEYEAPLNYYRAAAGLDWLNVVDRHARTQPLNDFYLLSEEDWRSVAADSFTVLRLYPLSRARLLQRRARPGRFLVTRSIAVPAQPVDSTWRVTLRANLSGSVAARSLVAVEGEVLVERPTHTRAELAIRFRRGDSSYSWHGASLQDFAVQPRTWYRLRLSCFVPAEGREGDEVTVTVDHQDTPVQLRGLTLKWLTAQD